MAGGYADQGRYVLTDAGRHALLSLVEVPALMGDFARWLHGAPDTEATAFLAHRRLVEMHPYNDGNGRTARLLMNLLLGSRDKVGRGASDPTYLAHGGPVRQGIQAPLLRNCHAYATHENAAA